MSDCEQEQEDPLEEKQDCTFNIVQKVEGGESNMFEITIKNEETFDDSLTDIEIQSEQVQDQGTSKEPSYKRMPDFCYYCKTQVLNFARHIQRRHSSEMEVKKIFSLEPKSKKRKFLISVLRKKGNHLNNSKRCVKPVRRSHLLDKNSSEYVPCVKCLGYYRPKLLWRHAKNCETIYSRDGHRLATKPSGNIRRNCKHCYKKLSDQYGYQVAWRRTKKVRTFCFGCKDIPPLCVQCFHETHIM